MSAPLHKAPWALLELFKLKTLGRAPDLFSDTVSPVIDVAEHYAPDIMITGSTTGSAGALPRVVSGPVTVGPNKLYALGGQITVGAAAGTTMQLHYGIILQPGGVECPLGGHQFTPVAAQIYQFGVALPKPIVMLPGATLYVRVVGDAGGADHVAAVRQCIAALSTG